MLGKRIEQSQITLSTTSQNAGEDVGYPEEILPVLQSHPQVLSRWFGTAQETQHWQDGPLVGNLIIRWSD